MSRIKTKFITDLAVTAAKLGSGAATSAQPLFANGSGGASYRSILAGDIPTLNQNTTGTAANITASSNATLTTLSSLSLPGSQVTGNIAGHAGLDLAALNNLTDVGSVTASFNNISPLSTKGDVLVYASGNTRLPIGSNGQVLTADSTQTLGLKWATPTATGTVTSVDMTVPSFLSVSGNPVTTSGTLAVTYSGTALPLANGGTGQTTKAAAFDALSPMTTGGDIIYGGASGTGTRLANGSAGQVLTSSGTTVAPTWQTPTVPTLTSLGIRSGKTSISSAAVSQAVVFSSTLGTTAYAVTAVLLNTTDANPQFQPVTITVQASTGFTASWNAPLDSANYSLSWQAILSN